jgi:hypothetical protein
LNDIAYYKVRQVVFFLKQAFADMRWIFHLLSKYSGGDNSRTTSMQEPSEIIMAITNNTPGETLWTHGCPTEDHQIRSGN